MAHQYTTCRVFSARCYSGAHPTHASAIGTPMELVVTVTPDVFLRALPLLLKLQVLGIVVAPGRCVSTADGALALHDPLRDVGQGDGDVAAMADGLDGAFGGRHG